MTQWRKNSALSQGWTTYLQGKCIKYRNYVCTGRFQRQKSDTNDITIFV